MLLHAADGVFVQMHVSTCMYLGRGCNKMFLSSAKYLTSVEDI